MPTDSTTPKSELVVWILSVLAMLVFLAGSTVALWQLGAPLAHKLFWPPDRPESHRQ